MCVKDLFQFNAVIVHTVADSLPFRYKEPSGIECFHSRGQHLCKFNETRESVSIKKEFNSHRIGLGHQHGRRFIVWDTNMAAVTSCENTLLCKVRLRNTNALLRGS